MIHEKITPVVSKVYIPGFGLTKAMYSNLDGRDCPNAIEIEVKQDWAKTIDNLAKNLNEKSILIGYSLGARLALATAISYPELVSGLVLLSVHAGLSEEKDREERICADLDLVKLFLKDRDAGFDHLDKNDIFQQNTINEKINDDRIENVELIVNQLQVLSLGKMPYLEDRLTELRVPVLYISGSRDPKFTELNAKYKKKTPFSHHKIIDSDHRVVHSNGNCVELNIEWFANQFF